MVTYNSFVPRGSADIPSLRRTKTTPIPVNRSGRTLDLRCMTSMPAGRMVPIAAFNLLREDQLATSRLRINFDMMETVEILMNAVQVNVKAYLVPHLAFDRFGNSMDALNRSYAGEPTVEGGTVIPYFNTKAGAAAGVDEVLGYMGKHFREGQTINTAYNEAYNVIWNFRAANRSPDITPRALNDVTLAPAFWQHSQFQHVVPDFDQATIDGEVPLNVVDGALPIVGLGVDGAASTTPVSVKESGKGATSQTYVSSWNSAMTGPQGLYIEADYRAGAGANLPSVYAEMKDNGVTVSLANIELARKTQAFAALRKQYNGLSDDYIIDMLMSGLTVSDQGWTQPILLYDRTTIFGMNKRYASDSVDLTASVVNGATFLDITLRTPQVPMGGVVMIVAEALPEQLFERQVDPFLVTTNVATLPDFLRDTLDPEKVVVVQNQQIDVDHDTPNGTFGYAPLNWVWNQIGPMIGGKFLRPAVDADFDEDRQRIWAVETENPTLSSDFYIVTDIHTKPFVVTDQDPFEAVMRGMVRITGNTVFGNLLIEASDDYDKIMAEAPIDRIDK